MKRKVYFYIDESGKINSDQDRFFILTCYITDTPDAIKNELELLQLKIEDDPYFAYSIKKFKKDGFHACNNHPDIRSLYYQLLPKLNIRIYSVVVDKSSVEYKDLAAQYPVDLDKYLIIMRKLLYDRILSEKNEDVTFVFEEYGTKPSNYKTALEKMFSEIKEKLELRFGITDITYMVEVHSKKDILLSVVDYANYPLYEILNGDNAPRMQYNFNIVEPKIALLCLWHNSTFYSSKKRINFDEIKGSEPK